MNDLLSLNSKEVIIYEKIDFKKYMIDFLLGFKKFTKNNRNVKSIYNNINNNFGKYFNIDEIIKQLNGDYYRGIGFTYNDISIIFFKSTPKEKIVKFQDILNKDNRISKKILNFVNTFINFVLEDNKNIAKYTENITKNNLLILNSIFVQQFFTIVAIKIDYVFEFIMNNVKSINIFRSNGEKESNNIPSYNYIIKDDKIIFETNYSLNFIIDDNYNDIKKVLFKVSAEINVEKNEFTLKYKTIIDDKNNLNLLYMFNSFYFYMKINNKFKDNKFKVEMLEYLKKIYNTNKSYQIIYNLLKNVESRKDITLILNIVKNNNLFIKYIYNENFKSIPKKIDNNKLDTNDFLLINYNEDNKSFNNDDISNIITKILFENPSFIIVSTQNCKKGGKDHYQHLLGNILENIDYIKLVKNSIDISRMRIYYNKNKVVFNEKKSIFFSGGDSYLFRKKNSNLLKENSTKKSNILKNVENGINKSKFYIKEYGIKESVDKKYGNGCVFMRLEVSINNLYSKFIFVNCNLSTSNETELQNIVNDFKLINYWSNGYNIFFCGNFNFTFKPYLYENTEISNNPIPYNASPKNFIREYVINKSNNKKVSSEKFIKSDTLALFLDQLIKNSRSNSIKSTFYVNLLNSIEKLGIHLTYKYLENEGNKQKNFYDKLINYNTVKMEPNYYINKFLDIPNLFEKIINNKDLVSSYFEIFIMLKLLGKRETMIYNKSGIKININKSNIIKTIINYMNKNLINKNTLNNLFEKYNIKNENRKRIIAELNFLNALKEQKNNLKQIENIEAFKIKFEENKKSIKNYLEGKDLIKLNKKCEKFLKNLITKGILIKNENNNIIIKKEKNDLLEKYNEIFNSQVTPYQSNRILYVLPNTIKSDIKFDSINTRSFDFQVYLFPDKSSYKLTTLSFDLLKGDILISQNNNNRSSITAVTDEVSPRVVFSNVNNIRIIPHRTNKRYSISNNEIKNERTIPTTQHNNTLKKSEKNTSIIPSGIVSSAIRKFNKN